MHQESTNADIRVRFRGGWKGCDDPPLRPRLQQSMQLVAISTGHPRAKPDRISAFCFLTPQLEGGPQDLRGKFTDQGNPDTLRLIILQFISVVIFERPSPGLCCKKLGDLRRKIPRPPWLSMKRKVFLV